MHIDDLFLALDPIAAAEVAAAHLEAPRLGGAADEAAYERLVSESDQLFTRLTQARRPIRIFFSLCAAPYRDADELIASIRHNRVLEVTAAASEPDRLHPVMDCAIGGAYDRFRAVHDIVGHGHLRVGFDRAGEYAVWRYQERLHSRLARRALASELHAEHSVRWTTGRFAEHKGAILDQRLIERSRAGRSPSTTAGGSAVVAGDNPLRAVSRLAA